MTPHVIHTIRELRDRLSTQRHKATIGCVPTMGALHAGHGALMDRARRECDLVVVTIFVNPIQFNQTSDFESYPRPLERDVEFCAGHRMDVVFAPRDSEMYPAPTDTFVEVRRLTDHLCGAVRPGHFRGVTTVVMKLFGIIEPHRAYFGEKDAQQLAVIRRMVRDLNVAVTIVGVPTVREPDGLAVSSRNEHLDAEERRQAAIVYQALCAARQVFDGGERRASVLVEAARAVFATAPAVRIEYLDVVDAVEMQLLEEVRVPARMATAAWVGQTRLIDNVPLYTTPAVS